MDRKSKRQERKELESRLWIGTVVTECIQKRPYTFLRVDVTLDDRVYTGLIGFSKVSWPDHWDERFGEWLTKKKIVSELSKRLMSGNLDHILIKRIKST